MITLSDRINSSSVLWNTAKEPCSWKGVKCNPSNSSVLEISLSGYSLSSSDFLPVVCEINTLLGFDVSNNHLSKIPEEFMKGCGEIQGLKRLNFSRNRLVASLPSFIGFVGLEFLDLSYNDLSGNINLELEGLVRLKSLNLSFNKFNGSIPAQLGNSKGLKELALSANSFQGTIPEEIMEFQNLTMIDLSQNQLSGLIPGRIEELSKLEVLFLSLNNLDGTIPVNLSNIPTLSRFAANQNSFYGAIPSGITKFLKNLDLSYNKLTGSIPSDLLSPSSLQTVDLTSNRLEGSIPENISPSLVRLRLGGNSLDGQIPSTNVKTLKQLMYLELDNNNLNGSIPPEFAYCNNLVLLNLAQNRLAGPLPPELGNLTQLQVLKLEFNDLSGVIPSQIMQLQKLSILNISSNSLSGQIPSTISGLQNLFNLHLQDNGLSGSIPKTICSMNSLLELQLGKNQLSGYIPKMPPYLQISLNLSNNLFEGPIPKTLAELNALEVLDLSNNIFSGEIPEFLTEMGALTQLSLANNSLSGVIPEFSSWVMINLSGNNDLINAKKSTNTRSRKGHLAGASVIAVTVALVSLLVGTCIAMLLLWYCMRKNLPQGNLLTENDNHRSNINFNNAMKAVAYKSNIVLITKFSTYFKAIMPSGESYFIKKLNASEKFQLACRERIHKQLEIFGRLRNTNVMTPLAYVLTVSKAFLLYEFAPKGTLFDSLHKSSGTDMDWVSRYSVAVGVAQGLAFLHGIAPSPILLLDLSTKNIFLKSLKEPMVGDIELYKVIDPSKSTGCLTTVAGSVGYIPPEYAYTMRITMAANVYSFGVVLLELLTGKQAVIEGTELGRWALTNSVQQDEWDQILDSTIGKTSPTVSSQMLAVLKVALGCVRESPEERPTMNDVLQMLINAK